MAGAFAVHYRKLRNFLHRIFPKRGSASALRICPVYVENSVVSLLLNIFTPRAAARGAREMVYRGYILRTLLPHDKVFAIVVSSAMFALMHGNLLQIPFAFIVGLTCGYLAVKTGKYG